MMTAGEKKTVKNVIATALRNKFKTYKPGRKTNMPFHTRLVGENRMALFSFIHSLNTTLGMSIYELVAEALAIEKFDSVVRSKKSSGVISSDAQAEITKIKNALERNDIEPNHKAEVATIRAVCRSGEKTEIKVRKADIYLVDDKNRHYVIELKTSTPNKDSFEKYKENMLKWIASILYEDPTADDVTFLGLTYNPNHPKPYESWTLGNMLEKGVQLKVGAELWDFIAGKPVFDDLLDCFEEIGVEMRGEIDDFFAKFK